MNPLRTRLSKYAWFAVVYNIFVVLWGALVRSTGSGAGCGSHWPLCNGEIIPRRNALETAIEFTHRITSGLAFLIVWGSWFGLSAPTLKAAKFGLLHRVRWSL